MTKKAAFEAYGASPRNNRWSWSAQRPDGAIVVTLWEDEFNRSNLPVTYQTGTADPEKDWRKRPGNTEQRKLLQYAKEHHNGEFFIILNVAKKPITEPRQIADCYPALDIRGRLVEFDSEMGDFIAEIVSPDDAVHLPPIQPISNRIDRP